mmetsp:Transcript_4101/g.5546  ORF Transcript_4101/g.5546 Transcript_4101/m.5546 type:complete len:282 (-) Transcript_4101:89-934(-)|eukprot:CAMPEP_0185729512 /NCGR_PEP_ID=MMETSP1171-20130828/6295_1 /TAXON_ID=374046 /ORGANISM="Helicotheca tamensis, Strain CCMP826" /LENGTH=281 /DNA_ID=CAMNT_0028398377 /DNA_START=45 /DNA_END=890 /DNA_ORIENTATION=-
MDRKNSLSDFGQKSMRNLYAIVGHSKSEGASPQGQEDNLSACEKIGQEIEIEVLRQNNKDLQSCLKLAYDDMDDRHAISEYAKLIVEASPSTINSSYVIRLQSQLHKALHKMGMLQNQMDLVKAQADEKIRKLQLKLSRQMDENLRSEQNTFQDLMDMDKEMSELKDRHKSEIKEHHQTISELRDQLEHIEQKTCHQSNVSEARAVDDIMERDEKDDENQDLRQKLQQKDLIIQNLLTRLASQESAQSQPSEKKDKRLILGGGPVKLVQMPRRLSSHAETA